MTNNPLQSNTSELLHQSSGLSIAEFIKVLVDKYPGQVTFSSSFSFEDQVITHEILHNKLDVKIFTLDTGRLFAETYSVWNSTNEKYNTHIKGYYTQAEELGKFIEEKGPN
jgi:phosphoadenosine phosphosulfate reductase